MQNLVSRLAALLFAGVLCLSSGFSAAATVSHSRSFASGWNLVGNSLSATIDVAGTFGPQSDIVSVWTWNAAASTWAFYSPSLDAAGTLASYAAANGYTVLSTINPGQGFWVKALAPVSLGTVSGTGFPLGTADLHNSWNLVATGNNLSPASLSANFGDVTTLWAWDNANNAWYFYAPALDADHTLSSHIQSHNYRDFGALTLGNGLGFWINYGGAGGSVVPPRRPHAGRGQLPLHESGGQRHRHGLGHQFQRPTR